MFVLRILLGANFHKITSIYRSLAVPYRQTAFQVFGGEQLVQLVPADPAGLKHVLLAAPVQKKMRQLGSEREEFEQLTYLTWDDTTNEACLSCAGCRPDASPCACPHIASKGRSLRTWSRYPLRSSDDPMWGSQHSSIACSLVGAPVVGAPGGGNY